MILLAVSAGVCLNLMVQFGLGVQELTVKKQAPLPLFQAGVLFVSLWLLWVVFTYILTPLFPVFFGYMLFFPLCVLVCTGLETLGDRVWQRLFPESKITEMKVFNPMSAYNGITLVALVLTTHIAKTFIQAFVVSLSFALGLLLSMLILNEIIRRSSIEAVPSFLRGKPLLLISIGFLSLIFTSAAVLLLKTV